MTKKFILFTIFVIKELTEARIKSLPAFATPKFSNSYVPATMQVILHAVEQLKHHQQSINTNILISSSPHPPGLTTWQIISKIGNLEVTTASYKISSEAQVENKSSTHIKSQYKKNFKPLLIHESNNLGNTNKTQEYGLNDNVSFEKNETEKNFETYKLKNPDVNRNGESRVIELADKKSTGLENLSSIFSLFKSFQIPVPASLQQLAFLYDALNKDARRQGLMMYTGYSDEVLKTLSSFSKSGIRIQLKTMLETTLERNELSREDTKNLVKKTITDLGDTKSYLSRDLRRLLPLIYTQ